MGQILLYITTIGTVCSCILGILSVCGKSLGFFKKIKEKEERKTEQHIVTKTTKAMDEKWTPILTDILEQDKIQNERIDFLSRSQMDLLRHAILQIYDENKDKKILTRTQRAVLDKIYNEYISNGGNGEIHVTYDLMTDWKIVD